MEGGDSRYDRSFHVLSCGSASCFGQQRSAWKVGCTRCRQTHRTRRVCQSGGPQIVGLSCELSAGRETVHARGVEEDRTGGLKDKECHRLKVWSAKRANGGRRAER